jgi:hypothetical protein
MNETSNQTGLIDSYVDKSIAGIDDSPKFIVLMIIMPDYIVIFAYFILFWQLLSLYFDGHANLFKSVF